MKILFAGTSENTGGAAVAAHRLYRALRNGDENVHFFVNRRSSDDPAVVRPKSRMLQLWAQVRGPLEQELIKRWYPQIARDAQFSPAWLPDGLGKTIRSHQPDILHVHWTGESFIRPETLRNVNVPVVWTLHDMAHFTGGCHYDDGCGRFRHGCGRCPMLGSTRQSDASQSALRRKRKSWKNLTKVVVGPSRWMAGMARESIIFGDARIEVIPNGIDLQVFRPVDKRFARDILCLPKDGLIVLFGAVGGGRDRRKGFPFLLQALQHLRAAHSPLPIKLAIFGTTLLPAGLSGLGYETHVLGNIGDERALTLAYSAADLFVAPSLQDNLPNTVIEASACGVPTLAFNVGGLGDLIDDGSTGWLVPAGDATALAAALERALREEPLRQAMGARAREKAEREFSADLQASRYLRLYQELFPSGPRGQLSIV
jgi:glycosyltransferase involved in cell wall biosynthesis